MNNANVIFERDWTEILKIVVCTKCKGTLTVLKDASDVTLYCASCSTYYPIRNDVIFMLKENNRSFKIKGEWDNAAEGDHIKAAAAVSKECVESPFVKLQPLPSEEVLRDKVHLDLGCGYGRTLIPCARHGTKISVGIDISSVMLDRAVELCNQEKVSCVLLNGDITDLPFEDSSFDIVYSSSVMLHLDKDSTKRAIEEVKRILKPGGKVYFSGSFPNIFHLWRLPNLGIRLASLIKQQLEQHTRPYHLESRVRYYTYSQVIHLFRGFSEVNVFSFSYQLLPKNIGPFGVPFRSKVKSINTKFSKRIQLKKGNKWLRVLIPLSVHFDVEATL